MENEATLEIHPMVLRSEAAQIWAEMTWKYFWKETHPYDALVRLMGKAIKSRPEVENIFLQHALANLNPNFEGVSNTANENEE